MLKNYFKIAVRNLLKYKAYSFINIAGLAIGIACCILILLFVNDELNYDKFHKNYGNIYRVTLDSKIGNNEFIGAVTPTPMAEALVRDFPQVKAAAKFINFGFPVLRYGDKVYSEEKMFWADSTIFDVFTVEFIKGEAKNALNQPNTMVMTEKMAKKYFGDEDPVGKFINSDNRLDVLVTGVVKEFPENSHFHFDFLGTLSGRQLGDGQIWVSNNYYTYFVLQEGTDYKQFEAQMNKKFLEYIGPQILQFTGIPFEEHLKQGLRYQYDIQLITDIHLKSNLENEIEPNSDITYVYIFSLIAVGILFIAIINFMNLSTARSSGRAKEVGIRKTLGSTFNQLIKQFLSESVVMSFIAIVLAVGVVYAMLPFFNDIAQKTLSLNLFGNIFIIPSLILLSIFIGILAGSYPAFFLASFKPVAVLSGKLKRGTKGSFLRSGLVIFQFAISIILIVGTIIIYNQLQYIQGKNLGFNKEQVLIVHKTDDIGLRVVNFVEELKTNPNVINASNSTNVMGLSFGNSAYRMNDKPDQSPILLWNFFTDVNFASTYQIKMGEGRFYSKDRVTDSTGIVINEAAIKTLGIIGDPIGQDIFRIGGNNGNGSTQKIIGVVKNFHFESLHNEIRPLAINLFFRGNFGRYVSVRVAAKNIDETIDFIEDKWLNYAGKQAFEYTFFDDDFARIYANEQRTGKLFTSFAVLAILIACLGLLGLAAFTAEQRTKEIGIRKTLGASVFSILILLSKEFTKWIIIANLIAWPISYFVMDKWLQDFHYRIDIGIWVFLTSGIAALLIAIITVSSQAVKAALSNPVDSLKYE
ncbi:MAG: hypothetical protein A2068_14575 [Ignavibacteria bacterium GWB2_35_6b]|nr:MAG: hypothetical protein A2068_14575 [Ignavibacteria bacterium GWB2_35_6b]